MQHGDDGWAGGLLFLNSAGYETDRCRQRAASDSPGVEDDADAPLAAILGIAGALGPMSAGRFSNLSSDMHHECNAVQCEEIGKYPDLAVCLWSRKSWQSNRSS